MEVAAERIGLVAAARREDGGGDGRLAPRRRRGHLLQTSTDFREPDNIRLGVAPIYTTFTEIYEALDRMKTVVEEKIYEQFSTDRLAVT